MHLPPISPPPPPHPPAAPPDHFQNDHPENVNPVDAQPWEKQPGEGRWYDRFITYLELGRDRSLHKAYLADRKARGLDKPSSRWIPGSWKNAAARFDWETRARAWDDHRSQQIWETFETTCETALQLAPEALQVLQDLLRGEDPVQRRIAATAILDWVASMRKYAARETREDPLPPIKYFEIFRIQRADLNDPGILSAAPLDTQNA